MVGISGMDKPIPLVSPYSLASNLLVGKFGRDDMPISSGKLSNTLHLPTGKSCSSESMIPNVLIRDKFCSSYSHQQPFKLQSWHASQSIYDHVDGDHSVTTLCVIRYYYVRWY